MKPDGHIHVDVQETMYNKTKVAEDGVTYIVDTTHDYKAYRLTIEKVYFTEEKDELIKGIMDDLDKIKAVFKRELEIEEKER